MSDDQKTDIPDNAPWWAKTGMQVAMNFGVPTVILLLIVLFILAREMGWAPNPVANELEKITAGMQQDAGHAIRHDATMQEMVKAVQEQTRHLEENARERQMRCVLKARTEDEKKACFPTVAK